MIKKYLFLHITKTNVLVAVLLCLCILPAVLPLFNTGFFISDDGEWMVIRFSAFYEALRLGEFPVRFVERLNHRYGYPVTNFLYPLFLYLGVPIKLLGFGFADSVKILFILSFFISGFGSYLWLRVRTTKLPAFVGALVYVYFPYHIYDLYSRGSIGEVLGLSILPFIFLCLERKKSMYASVFYAMLILSHNSLAFLFSGLLCLYILITYGYKKLSVILVGLTLSAFFWIPALLETKYTIFAQVDISMWQNYFVTVQDSSLIGPIGISVAMIAVYLLFKKRDKYTAFFCSTFFVSLFFSLPISGFLWEFSLLPKLVQFPWRFLLFAVLSGGVLVSIFLNHFSKQKQLLLSCIVILLLGISAFPFIQKYENVVRDEGYYTTNDDTTTVQNEYMPLWVKDIPISRAETPATLVPAKQSSLRIIKKKSHVIEVVTSATYSAVLQLNTIYYPGWVAYVNNKPATLSYSNSGGLIEVPLSPGENTVRVIFQETPMRFMANMLSLFVLCVLLALKVRTVSKMIHYRKN